LHMQPERRGGVARSHGQAAANRLVLSVFVGKQPYVSATCQPPGINLICGFYEPRQREVLLRRVIKEEGMN